MQALTRWRNFFTSPSFQFASFRSTPIHLHKNKTNNNVRRVEKSSKDQICFETRQKRADGKKALKSLLYYGGSPRSTIFQDGNRRGVAFDYDYANSSNRRNRPKSLSDHRTRAGYVKERKRKNSFPDRFSNRFSDSFSDECDEFDEPLFRVWGGYKCCKWSFMGVEGFFTQNPDDFFDWKQPPKHDNTHRRQKDWRNESDHESSDEETTRVQSPSREERILLGLPPLGDITIADVKKAFRLSALKWHPDKHQGPSQGMAQEKFRQCLDAYKHLCTIHSSPPP